MKLKFKKLNDLATLPVYATEQASGLDLSAALSHPEFIHPGESAIVPTGLALELPEGYEAQIRGRSGLAFKNAIFAHFGTIDADYRGELKVLLSNHSNKKFTIEPGMRIAQLVVNAAVVKCRPEFVDELSDTDRAEGGFGSTGSLAIEKDYTIQRGINLTNRTLDVTSDIKIGQETKVKSTQEQVVPHFRKGAPDQNEIMENLLGASKGKS